MPHSFRTQNQFRALFEFASEGILVADASGNIQVANPAAEKLFGYEPGELEGKKVEMLIPQRYARHHGALRDKFNDHPDARVMGSGRDLYGVKKSGEELPVEISLSPYKTDEGNFTIAFIIDISVRKKNELDIRNQKYQLEQLTLELEQRVKDRTMILEEALQQLEISRKELNEALETEKELNEMKSRFVSMASHEFRTPLATMLSSLSLINKYIEAGNQEKQQHHIERIKSSISNMTDLLDDVLSISKLEEGKISVSSSEVHLSEFTESIVQDMQEVAKPGQTIVYSHTGQTLIHVDRKILRVILVNLVSNAIKFSPEEKRILITSFVDDKGIAIKVKDDGMGISEEDQEHLFERFYRGNNVTNIQGTGLGLSIVAKYIELLNGKIEVQSSLGMGTLFTITLPNT